MTPTVSIVVPCYNAERTILQALQSLQIQTLKDWEAVVVIDGASDRSAQLARELGLQDPRIRMIEQDNQGLAAARNAGISSVGGEFICFLDADDVLLPTMLETLVHKFGQSHQFGAIYCGWIQSDPELRDRSWVVAPTCEGRLFHQLSHRNLFPCHSIMLRRETLENVGFFDCTLKHCHDWDLWTRVARTGLCFGCVHEPLVIYRMVPHSLSRTPRSFFDAGREVILRAHAPDDRVLHALPEFADGCACNPDRPLAEWAISCVGHALSIGDVEAAHDLFEEVRKMRGEPTTPADTAGIVPSLWFGAGVPYGSWEQLWARVGRSLLRFLVEQEERLNRPGFAMQTLDEIVGQSRCPGPERAISVLRRIVKAKVHSWRRWF